MHYFGENVHKTKVFLHKSENTLERDSDIIRIYVGICNKVVSLLLHFVLTFLLSIKKDAIVCLGIFKYINL